MTYRPWDQTVFATHPDGTQLVRYDKSGKYYLERAGEMRKLVTLTGAVEFAQKVQADGGRLRLESYGGQAFRAAYRKAVGDRA